VAIAVMAFLKSAKLIFLDPFAFTCLRHVHLNVCVLGPAIKRLFH